MTRRVLFLACCCWNLASALTAQTGPAPAGVQAVATSGSAVTVSWPAAARVRGFAAGRNCSGTPPSGCQANSGALGPTATSWNDAGLTAGTSYAYRVAVQYLDGRIGITDVSVTTPAVAAPIAPRTPGFTRNLSQAAVITGFSAPKVHAGETFSVLGTGMGYVTSVTVLAVERDWAAGPGKYRPRAGWQPVAATYSRGDISRLNLVMPLGTTETLNGGTVYQRFIHDQPVLVIVTSSAGPDTSDSPVLVDKTPVINTVEQTLVPAGETIRISGWNLETVRAGYLGDGTPGTFANPKLPALAYPMGHGAEVITDPDCNREGFLTLETNSTMAPTVGSQVRVNCAIRPQVTGVMPVAGAPGTAVQLLGKGLRDVVAVSGTGLPPITWSRVSDGELRVTLPSLPQYDGGVDLLLDLTTTVYGALHFPVTARPVVVMPPVITSVFPAWGEFGSVIAVNGKGLADYQSPGRFNTTVAIGGMVAPPPTGPYAPTSNSATRYVQVMGSNDPGNLLTVSHLGGTAQAPFIFVSGPSEIYSAQPQAVKAGQVLTVVGRNLARAIGLCMTVPAGNSAPWVARIGNQELPTTNDTLAVVVPSWAVSGPVGLNVRGQPTFPANQQSACQPSPHAVTIVP